MKQTYPVRGADVRRMRAERIMTQNELAELVGLSPQHISALEQATVSQVHGSTVKKLAAGFGVSPQEVVDANFTTAA